jgi:hypothetical protein
MAPIDLPDGDTSNLRSSFYLGALLQLRQAMRTKSNQEQQGLPECVSCGRYFVLVAFCPQCIGMICAECVNSHKNVKQLRDEHQATMLSDFRQENVDNFIKNRMLCKEKFHEKNMFEYYCHEETCKRCVCQKCAILFHQNHRMLSLEETAEEIKETIKQDANRVNKVKEKYQKQWEKSKKNMIRIKNEIDLAKQKVHDATETVIKLARDHETTMITALDILFVAQQTENDEEHSNIENGIKHLSEFEFHCDTLLDRDVEYEILDSIEVLKKRCKTLMDQASILLGKQTLRRDVSITYVTNQQIVQSLQDVGKIVESFTDPSRCTIESLNKVRCGFVNEFNVITRNAKGEVCPIQSIDVKIKDVEGNEVENEVFDEQNGNYRVSYKAEKADPYEILVNIAGEPIKNSPQIANTLDINTGFKHVITYVREGDGIGQFNRSIALSGKGEIAFADRANRHIQIFIHDGPKNLREFGCIPRRTANLINPFGVIFLEDKIIVSQRPSNEGSIEEFDLNGDYLRTIYRHEQWFAPFGMCSTGHNNIAVCCWGKEELDIKPSIKIFSKQGDIVHEFDVTEKEQPLYIAYSNGKYFVSFHGKNHIRVFDENGLFLYKFGEKGKKNGQFDVTGGLSGFGPDMIVICDYNNHRVQLLTQEGQFIRSFPGGFGSVVNRINFPIDLAVTTDGHVLILESGGNSVHVWR